MKKYQKKTGALLFFAAFLFLTVFAASSAFAQETAFLQTLTDRERAYIDRGDTITVIFSPNKGPIQYTDSDGTQKGISLDLLNRISDISGLKFEFTTVAGLEKIKNVINSGDAQLLAGIPEEDAVKKAYNVTFSDPYLDCAYGVILNRGDSIERTDNLTLALTSGLDVPENFQNVKNILRCDTIQECILAVSNGKADFTFGNSYVLEFYSQGYQFQNLCVVPFTGDSQRICFGVSYLADPALCGILDKAISYIGSNGILDIIIENVAASTQPTTLFSSISQNPRLSLAISGLILLLTTVLAGSLILNFRRKSRLARLEHQRFLLLSEAAKEYFYEYNFQTDTLELNPDTAQLFGVRRLVRRWSFIMRQTDILNPADLQKLEQFYRETDAAAISGESESKSIELSLPLPGGDSRWFRITRIVLFHGAKPAYIVGKLVDIEEEHKSMHELMKKSVSDSLTGIYNTVAAKEFISRSIHNMNTGVLFMFDLDYFKQINDRFGHQTGDRVIREFADILKGAFRENDVIARVGGDEFIVFAKNSSDFHFIESKCELLQRQVNSISLENGYIQTISIGVAKLFPDSTYESLFRQADAALYYVKEHGRAGYHIFE